MEKHLTAGEAWADFWKWLQEGEGKSVWAALDRNKRNYIHKANHNHKRGTLGYIRIKNILLEHAPDRYKAVEGFILKDDGK